MPSAKANPETIDEYLARAEPGHRAVLEKLRKTIHAVAPGVEEGISYGLAGFKLNGRPLVYFGAWANHCAFYPGSSTLTKKFHDQLKQFQTSKGTIRFTPDRPLPIALVRKLVKARIEENAANDGKKSKRTRIARNSPKGASSEEVQSVLATLKRLSKPRIREEMSSRYGIVTNNAFGVRMSDMQQVAKRLGRNHALALALWKIGNYEARTVAAFVAEPERLTPALMNRWCRDFDNWGICDTVCFKLFDQSPHAMGRVAAWARQKGEFQKRAAFALLACVALHDDHADDKTFTRLLPLIQSAATDERNFVKKGVSWALRAIGVRSPALKSSATALAKRLASSKDATSRWIGKDALRALT